MTLITIADGIISSDFRTLILASVDTVQDYAEYGGSTDLSYDDAVRVRNACNRYVRAGGGPNSFHQLVTVPLTALDVE